MIEKLGDIASYVNGFAFKPSEWAEEGLPIIRIQDLTGTSSNPNYYNKPYDKKYEINKGDVLISWSASLGVYIWCGEKALLNQHIFKVIFDKKDINKDFFVYQVSHILKKASEQAHGATMRHLTRPVFNSLPFWLPERNIQNKIADTLNLLSKLIVAKEKQVKELDKLIKSRFVEMFGDPSANTKRWKIQRLDEFSENLDFRRKPITASERVKGKYPYYGASGIVDYVEDYIFDDNILLISEDGANLLMRSSPVAFSVHGKVWVNNHAHVYKFTNICIQKYIEIYFSMIDISDQITGSAQPKLNQAKLNAMKFAIPDKIYLDRYYKFVCHIDKSKLAVQKSLEELETLKNSLMQQYFD
ncbi:restriction endonuclease subunit S [uncultured Acidaminococcus sp.]|jgi:type I restriction enzyme S subunit|uniref:restriction endonuclease subunit S n=1 Tax=uncultured Acidaminococcus sp. TaxID=352152 RepID=UPI00258C8403|nr:restriction endonuclease subunit S [uncultured Acidaminococcus sp.]